MRAVPAWQGAAGGAAGDAVIIRVKVIVRQDRSLPCSETDRAASGIRAVLSVVPHQLSAMPEEKAYVYLHVD